MRNTVAKKRVGQEDVDSDCLFGNCYGTLLSRSVAGIRARKIARSSGFLLVTVAMTPLPQRAGTVSPVDA
jgi:hypothetical protein